MGAINVKHTGSGADIALSSDGTSLLLDGTAIGGGASPDLFAESYDGTSTLPSATGTNSVAVGKANTASGTNSSVLGANSTASNSGAVALGNSAIASGNSAFSFGDSTASGGNSIAMGSDAVASATDTIAIGKGATAAATYSTAIGKNSGDSGSVTATGNAAMALGGSYASGTDSFAAAIANNTSSYGATGANSVAIGKQAKATHTDSIRIGYAGSAAANYSTSIGYNTTASGQWASCIGNYAGSATAEGSSSLGGRSGLATGIYSTTLGGRSLKAYGDYSVSMGYWTYATIIGQFAYASGRFSGDGDAQTSKFVLRSDTTDATAEALTTNNATASTDNQVILPNNSVYGFTGTIIARENSAQTNDFAVWEVKGGAVRAASASTTALGSYNINKISESTGAANWSIAISADTTNGAIAFTVTGEAAHSIRWVATINTTEVTY
jgi:trimeric autotransporter adhesin